MQQISGLATRGDTRAVRGILLDLDGVVYVRDTLLPGSLDAISKIEAAGIRLNLSPTRRVVRAVAFLRISRKWDFERNWINADAHPQMTLAL
jgi:hypothetical protein